MHPGKKQQQLYVTHYIVINNEPCSVSLNRQKAGVDMLRLCQTCEGSVGAPALCTEEPALTVELRPAEGGAARWLFWLVGEAILKVLSGERVCVWMGERDCEAGLPYRTGEDSLTGECSGRGLSEVGENGLCSVSPGEVGDKGLDGGSSVEYLVRGILLTCT